MHTVFQPLWFILPAYSERWPELSSVYK
jgi:hypothetical protein